MTLWGLIGLTVLRSTFVAILATAAAGLLSRLWEQTQGRWRYLFWVLILLPIFTPSLLSGYAWSQFSMSLIRYPLGNEGWYVLLMACRLMPVALGVLQLSRNTAPPPSAGHVRKLCGRPVKWYGWMQSCSRSCGLSLGAVWLLAMGDFDLASLMQIPSWTVRLFEARSLGVATSAILGEAAIAAAVQMAVILFLLFRFRPENPGTGRLKRAVVPSVSWQAGGWSVLILASALTVFLPLGMIGWESLGAFESADLLGRALREWGASLMFSAAAAVGAWVLAPQISRIRPKGLGYLFLIPALLGGMTLGGIVLAVFQWQPSRVLAHSPLPLGVGLWLWLLPMAWVLNLRLNRTGSATHAARLLRHSTEPTAASLARRLEWREKISRGVLIVGLLMSWAMGDVVLAKVLAPVDLTPLTALLYNQMHYGHNAMLSLMLAVYVGCPLVLTCIGAILLAGRAARTVG